MPCSTKGPLEVQGHEFKMGPGSVSEWSSVMFTCSMQVKRRQVDLTRVAFLPSNQHKGRNK